MKALILCAGQGTRLRPLTDFVPKCMVRLLGKPLIEHQLDVLEACSVDDVSLVTGYAAWALAGYGKEQFFNAAYASTNMVESMFCARAVFDGVDDLLVLYSDIVYTREIIDALRRAPNGIATAIDLRWHSLWAARMEDPLEDAESLKLNADGTILDLGRKARSVGEIEGQYIGATKISSSAQRAVLDHYDALDRKASYEGRPFQQMYMTTFLTSLIEAGQSIHAAPVNSGWLEVDTVADLDNYYELQRTGRLAEFWQPMALG